MVMQIGEHLPWLVKQTKYCKSSFGKRCVAAGYSNVCISIAKDPIKRKKWGDQVRKTRDK